MYNALLFFGLFVTSLATAAPCALHSTLDARDPLAPDFVLRSGYSRDNDDAAEGHYETAIFDLELVGHKQADGSGVCVYFVSTSTLKEHQAKASSYAAAWYVRKAGIHAVSGGAWKEIEAVSPYGVASKPQSRTVAGYMDGRMGAEFVRPGDKGPSVELRSELLLGKFTDGKYYGRVFFQGPTGRQRNGSPAFTNTDDSNYDIVRHVAEWRLELSGGALLNPDGMAAVKQYDGSVPIFRNQVRLATPAWNGSPVVIRASPREVENKYHSVGLLWRDVVALQKGEAGARSYLRYNLYAQLRSKLPAGVTLDERTDRLSVKRTPY
jgi:hypothetical protein